jgi:hypothetical protein
VSPEKSTIVSNPLEVGPALDIANAYFCGCPAGPTGLIALTTGR